MSRRKFLGGTAAGAGAALLIACGGSSGQSTQRIALDPSGVRTPGAVVRARDDWQLADETKEAVPGGIYVARSSEDLLESMDPHLATRSYGDEYTDQAYEYLVSGNVGPGVDPTSPEGLKLRPHLSRDYEISDDALRYTFTLRRGVKFQPIAPVNGREMNIDDWKTTMEYFTALSANRSVWNDVVDKAEFPDSQHMVIKLKAPYAPLLKRLWEYNFAPKITPKELNLAPNLMADRMIGTGFRMLDKHQPSIGWELKRFDDYWQGKPFIDRWHSAVIIESANAYAQFIAQNIISYGPGARDALNLRKDAPQAVMVNAPPSTDVVNRSQFGLLDAATAPWKDPRVRIGMHKVVNWDALLDIDSNRQAFKDAGIDTDVAYATHAPWNKEYWLDPRKGELGSASSNYLYDPTDGKRLMTAAGFADGFDLPYMSRAENNLTRVHLDEMKKVGIRPQVELLSATDYDNKVVYQGSYKGISVPFVSGSAPDVDYLFSYNFYSKGVIAAYTDAKLDEIIEASRRELDPLKRAEIIKDFQRHVASTFNTLPGNHRFSGWRFEWPWLHNINHPPASRAGVNNLTHLNWLDPSMPRRNG